MLKEEKRVCFASHAMEEIKKQGEIAMKNLK
jgi:ABC-type Na+ transport system ATPase subunit NatA